MFRPKERVYLTADGKRLVPEGHEDGATLFATPHQTIHEETLSGIDHSGVTLESGAEYDPAPRETESPSVRDRATIDPERSIDIHHFPVEERSAAADKVVANRATGLTAELEFGTAGGKASGAVSDRDVIEADVATHAARGTKAEKARSKE